jgi:hypothetical protein
VLDKIWPSDGCDLKNAATGQLFYQTVNFETSFFLKPAQLQLVLFTNASLAYKARTSCGAGKSKFAENTRKPDIRGRYEQTFD